MYNNLQRVARNFGSRANPFKNVLKTLNVDGKEYKYYSLPDLKDSRLGITTLYRFIPIFQ